MISRLGYIKWLDEFRDKKLIKVLTGLRRSGKSTILDMYQARLRQSGVPDDCIVTFNFELFENEPYLDPRKLHAEIVARISEGKTLYVTARAAVFGAGGSVAGRGEGGEKRWRCFRVHESSSRFFQC